MNPTSLEGELVVLNYSCGPYLSEDEQGGEEILTIWRVTNGKLSEVYHPHDPYIEDEQRPIELLKERGIRKVYTPTINAYVKTNEFLGLEMRNDGGEHQDEDGITDWIEYDGLCIDDYNYELLSKGGLDVILIKDLS